MKASGEMYDWDDAERLVDVRWSAAVSAWYEEGDGMLLAEAVRDQSLPQPEHVRELFAQLALGKAKRGKGGRPPERHPWLQRSMIAEVFAEWDAAETNGEANPKDAACEIVAGRRGVTGDTIRGAVDRLRGAGITRERWQAWGRPSWRNT